MIRWKRANDGFIDSHCGQWQITPLYWGCTRPQMFEVTYKGKVVSGYNSTQRQAKEAAEHIVERMAKK